MINAAKQAKAEVLYGPDSLCEIVTRDNVDVVVSAVVGSAGLQSTLAAVNAGKTVALANKESLVVGGELVVDAVKTTGAHIIPIDSEHSAICQGLLAENITKIVTRNDGKTDAKIILTASGGPFRKLSQKELERVTVADALAHPTWSMGRKITIDSATLMNKALEIIEARWLFDMPPEKISVVIHPQSIVHSMVEFVDGSVMAQLGVPDMRLPIQWAIDWPERFPGPAKKLDWSEAMTLEFLPPDFERFPALKLGLKVAKDAGTCGAVLNAANEVAVAAFLQERLPFHKITTVCQSILEHHNHERRPTFEQLLAADRWARLETEKWISR
jgi:1-deoxy-D-xylulose-5-phosphate reductoisomerase